MNNIREDLLKELKEINVSAEEQEELLQVAFRMNNLSVIRRSYEFKKAQAEKILSIKNNSLLNYFIVSLLKLFGSLILPQKINKRVLIPVLVAVVFLLGTSSIVLAQKSLPGEALYPFKRVSEDVIVTFNPVFKEEVFKRRVEENKIIIERKKVSDEQIQLKEEEKNEKTATPEANEKNEIKIESESSKEKIEDNKKEEKKKSERNGENEAKNDNVKGAEDKRVELNEERKRENDKKNNNQKEENKE